MRKLLIIFDRRHCWATKCWINAILRKRGLAEAVNKAKTMIVAQPGDDLVLGLTKLADLEAKTLGAQVVQNPESAENAECRVQHC